MSSLKAIEKVVFEKLFNRGGYVLNFTDATFSSFFGEFNIDIDNQQYHIFGSSKMKRLRGFWEIEPDEKVGLVMKALLEYACAVEVVNKEDIEKVNAVDSLSEI